MSKSKFIFLSFVWVLFSCKKEAPPISNDDCLNPEGCEEVEWELPSSVGSYWIYEWFLVDSTGADSSIQMFDTISVVGDTVINDAVFAIYEGTYYGNYQNTYSYVRDSSGYIIDDQGNKSQPLFPSGEVLHESTSQIWNHKVDISSELHLKSVPAGTFNCVVKNVRTSNLDGSDFNVCGDQEFVEHTYYDPKKGKIASQLAYISEQQSLCRYREQRLIEYYIAP